LAASYVSALEKEMARHIVNIKDENRVVNSVYLGGGTPTVLSGEQLVRILDTCRRLFRLAGDAEITVECNPGTVDLKKLSMIREAGANRVSIGVQAYQQKLLTRLGRIHRWQEVVEAVDCCRRAGIENLNLDLIFGIPGQTMEHWRETMEMVLGLSPEHISAYNLKIELNTPLHREVDSGYLAPCDEELELLMYWYTVKTLTGAGFKHYEISNFARPGYPARHNLVYWQNGEYLGLGPAAHSMIDGYRFSNVESVELYISKLGQGEPVIHELHRLTRDEQISETVFLGLRLLDGLNLDSFAGRFGETLPQIYGKQVEKLIHCGLLELADNKLKLTEKGIPLANEVFAEFVQDSDS